MATKLAVIFASGALCQAALGNRLWSAAVISFVASFGATISVFNTIDRENRRAAEGAAREVYELNARLRKSAPTPGGFQE